MINLNKITQDWERDGEWRIAPADFHFMAKGSHLIVCGDYVTLGDGAHDIHYLGYADKFAVYLSQVDGIAYISSGCKWMSLKDARNYVKGRDDCAEILDRINYAAQIAKRISMSIEAISHSRKCSAQKHGYWHKYHVFFPCNMELVSHNGRVRVCNETILRRWSNTKRRWLCRDLRKVRIGTRL